MKKAQLIIAVLLLAGGFSSYAQAPQHSPEPKLIAVVNKASWCGVCKANAARFGAVLLPYASEGVNIYFNDLTNEATKGVSQQELQNANVYETITTIPRKGVGKMLKACGIVKDKKQTQDIAGIVTFIDAKTHKQLKQLSIAESDAEIQKIINNLLK